VRGTVGTYRWNAVERGLLDLAPDEAEQFDRELRIALDP
jgi:hypothetical protein